MGDEGEGVPVRVAHLEVGPAPRLARQGLGEADAAGAELQKRGLVEGRPGAVNILDAEGLHGAACNCRASLAFTAREIQEASSPVCGA